MKSVTKSIRISPKKLNLVAELIRGQEVTKALKTLEIVPKKGAKILHKAVKSASSNAVNNFNQDEKDLIVEEVYVTKAATLKRWIPAARGRMSPILKRNSHLTIKLNLKEKEEEENKTDKISEKTSDEKEVKNNLKKETKSSESKKKEDKTITK